ncbi:MAG: hypothetical protein HC778_04955, partial [Chamaesiphon sp. CSU_1_12]|nr:hypothetical protein [Chamaesiphon sp. CSU_1_12]
MNGSSATAEIYLPRPLGTPPRRGFYGGVVDRINNYYLMEPKELELWLDRDRQHQILDRLVERLGLTR